MAWDTPKASHKVTSHPRHLSWIIVSVAILSIFLIFASSILVSYPIGSMARGYFDGVDSSRISDLSISPILETSSDVQLNASLDLLDNNTSSLQPSTVSTELSSDNKIEHIDTESTSQLPFSESASSNFPVIGEVDKLETSYAPSFTLHEPMTSTSQVPSTEYASPKFPVIEEVNGIKTSDATPSSLLGPVTSTSRVPFNEPTSSNFPPISEEVNGLKTSDATASILQEPVTSTSQVAFNEPATSNSSVIGKVNVLETSDATPSTLPKLVTSTSRVPFTKSTSSKFPITEEINGLETLDIAPSSLEEPATSTSEVLFNKSASSKFPATEEVISLEASDVTPSSLPEPVMSTSQVPFGEPDSSTFPIIEEVNGLKTLDAAPSSLPEPVTSTSQVPFSESTSTNFPVTGEVNGLESLDTTPSSLPEPVTSTSQVQFGEPASSTFLVSEEVDGLETLDASPSSLSEPVTSTSQVPFTKSTSSNFPITEEVNGLETSNAAPSSLWEPVSSTSEVLFNEPASSKFPVTKEVSGLEASDAAPSSSPQPVPSTSQVPFSELASSKFPVTKEVNGLKTSYEKPSRLPKLVTSTSLVPLTKSTSSEFPIAEEENGLKKSDVSPSSLQEPVTSIGNGKYVVNNSLFSQSDTHNDLASTAPIPVAGTISSTMMNNSTNQESTFMSLMNKFSALLTTSNDTFIFYSESISTAVPVSSNKPNNESDASYVNSGCDLYRGNWIYDKSGPLYTNNSCPVITQKENCQGNGRPDKDYENWRWMPFECDLPRFDPRKFLELMRDKTLAFIGDSVSRNQMESMLCILWQVEKPKNRGNRNMHRYYFKSTSVTIVRIWSSWLVEHNKEPFDFAPDGVDKLFLDVPEQKLMKLIPSFDVIVVSSGHWFGKQSVYILNQEIVGGQLWWPDKSQPMKVNNVEAFSISVETFFTALVTHPNYTGLTILRTYSPDHYEGGAWNTGGSCTGKVKPLVFDELVENMFTNTMHEQQVASFDRAIKKTRNRSKMRLMDITKAFEYRHDGHPGPYRNPDTMKITARGPDGRPPPQDCLHWCMPGPVDTWNQLVFEIIRREYEGVAVQHDT